MRIILFTGKGGVGKTSVAAATAIKSAELGNKTIIISTDVAHSLRDSFDQELSAQPVKISKNLWAQEIDILEEMERNWGLIQHWISQVLAWKGIDEIIADELTIFPGMEEVFSLFQIKRHSEQGNYDAIIVDCAPTGEALRLLSFPEIARWWVERLFPLERTVAKVIRPLLQPLTEFPLPGDEIFGSVESLLRRLDGMEKLLANPKTATVRLVINPEKMVIKEAQRSFTTLNLFGYIVDAVIVNRLIPDEVNEKYFSAWKKSQSKYYQLIEECFSPLPILTIPLFKQEVVGEKMLKLMAETTYGNENPLKIMFASQPQAVSKKNGKYTLNLMLPFISKEDVSLIQKEDDLVVKVGGYKRQIVLPRVLRGLETSGAKLEKNHLLIRFEEGKQ